VLSVLSKEGGNKDKQESKEKEHKIYIRQVFTGKIKGIE
jgi:hypothetical protein